MEVAGQAAAEIAFAVADGFYATVELRREPPSAGRELAVVCGGRVLDLSPGLRARGVVPGLRCSNLLELFPETRLVDYEPERYREAWEEVLDLCAARVPAVEPLDPPGSPQPSGPSGLPAPLQAFLDLGGLHGPRTGPDLGLCRRLGRDIRARTGVAVCFGLGGTKLLARAAGLELLRRRRGEVPRAGETLVFPGGPSGPDEAFLASLPVSYLYPFPSGVAARLERLGLRTLGEVRRMPVEELARHFGRALALRLARAAAGGEEDPVRRAWPPPSFEVVRRVPGGLRDRETLTRVLREAADVLSREMGGKGLACREVLLAFEGESGRREEASRRLPFPVCSRDTLALVLLGLAERLLRAWVRGPGASPGPAAAGSPAAADLPVAAWVRARRVELRPLGQLDLGLHPGRSPQREVEEVLLGLSLRFGERLVRPAGETGPARSRRERLLTFYDPLRSHGQAR